MNGFSQFGLGRIKSPFDFRDYNLRNFIPRKVSQVQESDWPFTLEPLDQKDTGHCVGFSMADFGINNPMATPYSNQDGHDFYYRCKIVDNEPGQENGSYIRSAAKVMLDLKMVDVYAFALDMATLDYWLLNNGPVIVGTIWTNDMFVPDANNFIHPTGATAGGHAYLLNAKRPGAKRLINSWGDSWGQNGQAWISDEDFEKIFNYDGEAVTAFEIKKVDPSNPGKGCSTTAVGQLIKRLFNGLG